MQLTKTKNPKLSQILSLTFIVVFLFFTLPAFAQTNNNGFDLNNVNSAIKSQSSGTKELMLNICVLTMIVGIGMVAVQYVFQVQSAKAGLISLAVGILMYMILRAINF